ncbi:LamG domain-containing protein [archaeon]|jgi:hypothetical protein|nr:LamG domain-containing protein [archaeon]
MVSGTKRFEKKNRFAIFLILSMLIGSIGIGVIALGEIEDNKFEVGKNIYTNQSKFSLELAEDFQDYSKYSLRVMGSGDGDFKKGFIDFYNVLGNLSVFLSVFEDNDENNNLSIDFNVFFVENVENGIEFVLREEGLDNVSLDNVSLDNASLDNASLDNNLVELRDVIDVTEEVIEDITEEVLKDNGTQIELRNLEADGIDTLVNNSNSEVNKSDENKIIGFARDIGIFAVEILNIIYPTNVTSTNYVTELNYTTTGNGSCWYSIDGGAFNYTAVSSGVNWTELHGNSSLGSNTWIVWCNDTAGSVNSSSVIFSVDNVVGNVTISSPVNGSWYGDNTPLVNVSSSEVGSGFIVPDLDGSLVSWWRMDDYNGSHVSDYVGVNNGSAVGGASQVDNGKFGKGFSFDGSDGKIDTGSDFIGTGEDSACMWIYPRSRGESDLGRIVSNGKFQISSANSNTRLYLYGGDGGFAYSNSAFFIYNTWIHACVTRNSTGFTTFYKNGVYDTVDSSSGTPTAGTTNVIIGNTDSEIYTFNGTIDELMIFNRTLSAEEVLSLYNATRLEFNTSALADGAHDFTAYTSDLAGNVNSSSANFSVDTSLPNLEIVSPMNGSSYNNGSVLVNVSSSEVGSGFIVPDLDGGLVSWWRMDRC